MERPDRRGATVNADEHPLMQRFHKPGDEKRSLVVLPQEELDSWLTCKDPEMARSFLRHYPADAMKAWLSPLPPRPPKEKAKPIDSLF
jgi:putative SOS response-associated peptidase YedK